MLLHGVVSRVQSEGQPIVQFYTSCVCYHVRMLSLLEPAGQGPCSADTYGACIRQRHPRAAGSSSRRAQCGASLWALQRRKAVALRKPALLGRPHWLLRRLTVKLLGRGLAVRLLWWGAECRWGLLAIPWLLAKRRRRTKLPLLHAWPEGGRRGGEAIARLHGRRAAKAAAGELGTGPRLAVPAAAKLLLLHGWRLLEAVLRRAHAELLLQRSRLEAIALLRRRGLETKLLLLLLGRGRAEAPRGVTWLHPRPGELPPQLHAVLQHAVRGVAQHGAWRAAAVESATAARRGVPQRLLGRQVGIGHHGLLRGSECVEEGGGGTEKLNSAQLAGWAGVGNTAGLQRSRRVLDNRPACPPAHILLCTRQQRHRVLAVRRQLVDAADHGVGGDVVAQAAEGGGKHRGAHLAAGRSNQAVHALCKAGVGWGGVGGCAAGSL